MSNTQVLDRGQLAPPQAFQPLLEGRDISIHFGGLQALVDVSVKVAPGESVGLVGPNGAGKTTLFNCLCGQYKPTKGEVWFSGVRIDGMPVYKRARMGIGRTFQRVEVFPELTVRQHVFLGVRAHRGTGRLWKDLLNRGAMTPEERTVVDSLVEMVGLSHLADQPVAGLSLGHCRLVELARALALEPKILMADEPSSGLDVGETARLAQLLRRVQRERGTAVLLVEHDLSMVAQVVDRAMVLDFGHLVAEGTLEEVMADPEVRRAYLGYGK
jgi:branched-chain amino acid transport system ATP-binding protein